jgi:hypothetical protein
VYILKINIYIHGTKNYLDATNKGSICWIQRKHKICITVSIRALFWCLIYRHNIHLSSVLMSHLQAQYPFEFCSNVSFTGTISIWALFWCLIYRHNIHSSSVLMSHLQAQYPFEFCSDVSFTGTIFSRNWHVLFVLSLLISDLTFMFLLLLLFVSVQPDISKIFFFFRILRDKQLFTQKCATNYQAYLENKFNNFWTWNNSLLIRYHTGDSAEWIMIIWAQFGGQLLGTPRLTALTFRNRASYI